MPELDHVSLTGGVPGEGHSTQYHKSGISSPASFLRPLFSVYQLGSSCHKVIKFHDAFSDMGRCRLPDNASENPPSEGRYRNHIARAKTTVTELIMSNEWDYFFTGTLDPVRYDRYNLSRYKSQLSQFIRDQRKKYSREGDKLFRYVLVPERHADGAWHIHGVLGGVPDGAASAFPVGVPQRLIDGGYLNWSAYQDKFGFCSLGKLRDPFACAFYIRKYISKGFADEEFERNEHMYFASLGLTRRSHVSDYFSYSDELESCLSNYTPWCETGYVQGKPWHFGFDGDVFYEPMAPVRVPELDREVAAPCPEWEQMQLGLDELCSNVSFL